MSQDTCHHVRRIFFSLRTSYRVGPFLGGALVCEACRIDNISGAYCDKFVDCPATHYMGVVLLSVMSCYHRQAHVTHL